MTPSSLRWHRHQHCIDPQTPKLLFPAILHITLHFPSHRHSLLHTCICLHSAFCTLMTPHLGSAHRMALHSPSSPVHHCYPRISTLEPGLVLVPSSGYPARALLCYATLPLYHLSIPFLAPFALARPATASYPVRSCYALHNSRPPWSCTRIALPPHIHTLSYPVHTILAHLDFSPFGTLDLVSPVCCISIDRPPKQSSPKLRCSVYS